MKLKKVLATHPSANFVACEPSGAVELKLWAEQDADKTIHTIGTSETNLEDSRIGEF